MLSQFLDHARKGNPVYIHEVYSAFQALPKSEADVMLCVLSLIDQEAEKPFRLSLPKLRNLTLEELDFTKSYIWAEIYNILSGLGGKKMTLYIDTANTTLMDIVENLNKVFSINEPRNKRVNYGRSINVIDRMLTSLTPEVEGFRFIIKDSSEHPSLTTAADEGRINTTIFTEVVRKIHEKTICGLDVGGTDIKAVLVKNGKIDCYKEYDWFPAKFTESKELVDPILLIVRLFRAKLSLQCMTDSQEKTLLMAQMDEALQKDASEVFMLEVVTKAEAYLNYSYQPINALGLCFPDVVVKNKVVGGEVYKTRGIRNNPSIQYEEDFMKLTDLNDALHKLIEPEGQVNICNDGPMASFTAAVEIAAIGDAAEIENGVFAHTLGTELGTGWVKGDGSIPDIPLEVYNFIIDLGSFIERDYPSDDLRSINNFNTELPGTLQKYCSQSGIFRLALKYFPEKRPDLFKELLDLGYVVEKDHNGHRGYYVPTEPKDMRKPFLEHMMSLPEREGDKVNEQIWRELGEFLAVTWIETEKILHPAAKSRYLFGRLVKNRRCFELIQEGARSIVPELVLKVADSEMANTPLMQQLESDRTYTVAQFAQAVGAVYFSSLD